MKGYLERLALGVMRPVGSIHPLVGSVFSPREHTSRSGTLSSSESALVSSESESRFTDRQREEKDGSSGQEPSGLQDPRSMYRPLMSNVTLITSGPTDQATTLRTEDRWPVPQESASFPPLAHEAKAQPASETDRQLERQAQDAALSYGYQPIKPMMNGNERGRGDSWRRTGPVEREPDEIQIHIGRIEVTAVQQTSVQPAVKPTRKGMSLDEYLKRANGRVR